ncbi:hypothetical protein I6H07_06115 [Hafnia alvei]|nr:hypothetical protein [Hafnia alvei]MBI0275409.1 hypothetical protein [Hafnia alvei]PNK98596.1 hypothetical protein CEQ28_013880 [Hafnia alvei]
MACELLNRTITDSKGQEIVFAVRQLPATRALDLQVELCNVMGTQVFPFIEGKFDFNNIIKLMCSTEHAILSDLIKRVVLHARREGVEVTSALFDSKYDGELFLVFKVFAFVCEVNFKDFFSQGLAMTASKLSEEAATSEQK